MKDDKNTEQAEEKADSKPEVAKPEKEGVESKKEAPPEKEFDPRDFCCMSGCQNCVLYDDDFGKDRPGGKMEEVEDPALAAFLAMEKRMAEMNKPSGGSS